MPRCAAPEPSRHAAGHCCVHRSAAPSCLSAQPNSQPTSSHPYCPPSLPPLSTAFGRADYFDDLVASVNDMTRGNDWFLLGALRGGGRLGGRLSGCPGVLARRACSTLRLVNLPTCWDGTYFASLNSVCLPISPIPPCLTPPARPAANDFASYMDAQDEVDKLYKDQVGAVWPGCGPQPGVNA